MRKIDGVTLSTSNLEPERIPAQVDAVKETVPDAPGTYLLFAAEHPMYVGRSDTSLRGRLAGHEYLSVATHVSWKPRSSAEKAFYLESAWFHEAGGTEHLLNEVHPGIPDGTLLSCPFCKANDGQALQRAAERMVNTV